VKKKRSEENPEFGLYLGVVHIAFESGINNV
jgi:hypothetical protein